MPKLLQLCSLLDQTEINIDAIVSHVSLLFENSLLVRQKLKSAVQVCKTSKCITITVYLLGCSSLLSE